MKSISEQVVVKAKGRTKKTRKVIKQNEETQFQSYDTGKYQFQPFVPLSEKQKNYYHAIMTNTLSIAIGPAGTGKSFVGASAAASLLAKRAIEKIIITRSPLPTGQTAGFRPGDTYEKLMPYLMPLIHTFKKVMKTPQGSDGLFNYLFEKRVIEIQDLETIKGASFENTFVIVEEAQECDMEQLKNLLTRCSDSSFIFLNGDLNQSNKRLKENALSLYVEAFRNFNQDVAEGKVQEEITDENTDWIKPIPILEFDKSDRNGRGNLVRLMLEINDRNGF